MLTHEDIDALPAGTQMDILVDRYLGGPEPDEVPRYSTSIAQAWRIIEFFSETLDRSVSIWTSTFGSERYHIDNDAECDNVAGGWPYPDSLTTCSSEEWYEERQKYVFSTTGETMPLAIARFALKASLIPEEKTIGT